MFQATAQPFNGNRNPANERQIVVGEHGDPQRLFQPRSGVQIVIRVIVLADEDDLVKLDGERQKHRDDQDEVQIAGVEQGIHEEPEALQALPDRMLAHFQTLHLVADVAVWRDPYVHVVVEAILRIQHQPAGTPGGDVGRAIHHLLVKERQVGRKHQVDALLPNQLQQLLPEGGRLQVVVFIVEQGWGFRLQKRVANKQDVCVAGVVGQKIPEPAHLPAPGRFAGAVQENQPGITGPHTVEMGPEMIIKPETAKILVFVRAEGEQIGNVQVAQGAIQCPVFILATAAHGIAGRHQKVHTGLIQGRDKPALEDAHGIVDVAHHRKTDTGAWRSALVDAFNLLAVQGLKVLFEEIQVHLVAHQRHHNGQAQIEQQFKRVTTDHSGLRWLLISSLCITSKPMSMPR